MKKSLLITVAAICFVLFSALPSFAQKKSSPKHDVEEINVLTVAKGDKIRGPKSIKPIRVNRIRYSVAVKTETTFTAGPSLALPGIIPPVGASGGTGAAADTAQGLRDTAAIQNETRSLIDELDTARKTASAEDDFETIRKAQQELIRRRAEIQTVVQSLLSKAKIARDATDGFVRTSDDTLRNDENGPQVLLRRLPDLITKIDSIAGDRWPDVEINDFLADIDIWESDLGRISDLEWLVRNKDRVDAVKARFQDLRDSATALSRRGPADGPAATFEEVRRVLGEWREIFKDALREDEKYFELPYVDVGCGFSFDQNKETQVKLVKQDRLAPAGTDPSEQELTTVVCSSPFSISGGFGFSTVDERDFVFVQSTKEVTENGQTTQKVINRFGFKNKSSFRPIPLLLLNTRIYEQGDDIAYHISAGAGVDIKTGETGSDVEFIVGPSVSFKRSMFITAGVHIGRVPKLAGGFEIGQEVPEGINEPPLEKEWKPGFIFAITFKLR